MPLHEAEQALRSGPLESGLQSIASARDLVRHRYWQAELQPELQTLADTDNQIKERIEQDRAAQAQQREKQRAVENVQQQMSDLINALEAGNPAWGTTAARDAIEQTNGNPRVQEAGLTGVLKDCQTIQARAAALLQQPQARHGFAEALQARLIVRDRSLPPDSDLRLRMRWNIQQESLQNEILDLGQRLATALKGEVDRVVTQSELDLTDAVQLYWEARWCLAALEDAAQLERKDATIARLTGALRDADRLPASVLTSEVFGNLAYKGSNDDDAQLAAIDAILNHMQAWLTQAQELPAGIGLPDERGGRYQPRWEIGADVISEGQRLCQTLRSTHQDVDIEQRLSTLIAFNAWTLSLNTPPQNTPSGGILEQEASGNA